MGEFIDTSLSFPTVVFSFAFVVVIGFWLFVLVGVADFDIMDAGGADSSAALSGLLPVVRRSRGIPVTVALSLWIILSWVACEAGSILVAEAGLPDGFDLLIGIGLLVVSPVAAWVVTLIAVLPFGRFFDTGATESRHDFVGKTCIIRTGSVSRDFGQAEITSTDGSSAVIQVRLGDNDSPDAENLTSGATALIFDYDPVGEHFLVAPFDLPTGRRGHN